jgi:hypothetical protein
VAGAKSKVNVAQLANARPCHRAISNDWHIADKHIEQHLSRWRAIGA